jgi:hypothetical protein
VTEREIIEAELREIISLEEYETSSGLGREEYESDVMTWSCAIAAALRESRNADVTVVRRFIEHYCNGTTVTLVDTLALSKALDRLAGDE